MHASKYIPLAVDDSEATARAVTYVASIIGGQPGFRLCLLHISAPLPPKLLEFGGAENPAEEETQLAIPLSGEAVVANILEAARANQCGTVVVGRQSFSWPQELSQHHIGEELLRKGQGLAIWVVE